ncbi:MAG: hypothetical protein HC917_06345 [Richelia sp. SM2_1_7]|nr:hypothetical protein [Richelia sp. SM2_1_7]
MNILKVIKSKDWLLWYVIVMTTLEAIHAGIVINNLSQVPGIFGFIHSWLLSFGLSLGVLIYTLRKNKAMRIFSLIVMVFLNGYYYYLSIGISTGVIPALFLSLVIPFSIYKSAEEI